MWAVSGTPVSTDGEPPADPVFAQQGPPSPTEHPKAPDGLLGDVYRAYPAQSTQPIEPILIPKLRIRLAEFPYATLFYAPETAHLGDLMRIRYG